MGEASREVTIVNKRGLHARASAKFVAAVADEAEAALLSAAGWEPAPVELEPKPGARKPLAFSTWGSGWRNQGV